MFVSTSQRTKGLQRVTDLTSRLILGLGTRVVAIAEAVIMANAIWMVQFKDVKSFSELLFLSEFLSIGIFVWLAFTGAGKISLDHWLVHKLRGAAQPR